MIEQLNSLAASHGIEPYQVIDILKFVLEDEMSEQINVYFKNETLYFAVQNNSKLSINMGNQGVKNEISFPIFLEKSPNLYNKVLKKFQVFLEETALETRYKKSKTILNSIIKSKIIKITKNGMFCQTPYGQGFCPKKYWVLKEQEENYYKINKSIYFHVNRIQKKSNLIYITLSRTSQKLTKFIINENFPEINPIYNIKRVPGVYTKIYLSQIPDKETTKQLRYQFGGERIIYCAS